MKKIYRIGCVGLLNDAPLHVALAKGWFEDHGLQVELSRELGWAALTSKLAGGKLAAANVSALFPLVSALQRMPANSPPFQVLGLTSLGGLGLTLSPEIDTLLKNKGKPTTPLRIGVESPRGDAHLVVRAWKNALGLASEDTVLVPIAVSQCVEAFREGYIQGFCAQEPYTSVAEQAGVGVTVACGHDYFPHHPRSGLAVTQAFQQINPEVCAGFKAALQKACAFCARPENWAAVKAILLAEKRSFAPESASVLSETALLPRHLFFQHPSGSPCGLDQTGSDFLCKACLATDPSWRESEVRAVLGLVYGNLVPAEPAAKAVERRKNIPVAAA
jgi:ABC-type nitrate/sulfonate/bicarbonate transport system substrate-binding protein